MTVQYNSDIVILDDIYTFIPIVNCISQRVMHYQYNGFLRPGFLQLVFQPGQYITWNMTIIHAQNGTLMKTDKFESGMIKDKFIIPPESTEISASRSRPFCVMISGNDIIGHLQSIKDLFGQSKMITGIHIGYVSGHNDKINISLAVDISDGISQINCGRWSAADMRITEKGETK
jgi:hypothetical protein